MKLSSPQTYKIIRFALETPRFKQIEVHRATNVAFSRVNAVVNWMVSRGFAAKGKGGYHVVAPAALLASFALFRQMKELQIRSFMVETDRKRVLSLFEENGAVLCLSSALSFYDDYFRDPSFHVYGSVGLCNELSTLPEGLTQVVVYRDDLADSADIVSQKGVKYTGKIRTLVDLLCSERAYASEQLIKKTWA